MKPSLFLICSMAYACACPPARPQQILPTPLSPRIKNRYGFIDIDEIRTSRGEDLTSRLKFIQPDEDLVPNTLTLPDEKPLAPDIYGKDQTVVSVPLVTAVLPDSI